MLNSVGNLTIWNATYWTPLPPPFPTMVPYCTGGHLFQELVQRPLQKRLRKCPIPEGPRTKRKRQEISTPLWSGTTEATMPPPGCVGQVSRGSGIVM